MAAYAFVGLVVLDSAEPSPKFHKLELRVVPEAAILSLVKTKLLVGLDKHCSWLLIENEGVGAEVPDTVIASVLELAELPQALPALTCIVPEEDEFTTLIELVVEVPVHPLRQ